MEAYCEAAESGSRVLGDWMRVGCDGDCEGLGDDEGMETQCWVGGWMRMYGFFLILF